MQEHAGLEPATTIFNIEHNVGMCWQGHAFGMDRVWIWYGSSSHTVWRFLGLASRDHGTHILRMLVEHCWELDRARVTKYKKRSVEKQPASKLSAVSKLF